METPNFSTLSDEDKNRLRSNIRLAQQLGAKIETVYGDDISYQISEFARVSGVSKIVIGRSTATRRHIFSKTTLTEKLIINSPNLDIHIIPDSISNTPFCPNKEKGKFSFAISSKDIFKSIGMLILTTIVGIIFSNLGFSESNIITVYILGVLVTSIITTHRVYSLISSFVSVLVFNFLFTVPKFTFLAYDKGYPVTFIIMFVAALITGTLATKLKNHAKQAAQSAYRTKVLFDTNQLLHKAKGKEEIISSTANQLIKLLGRDVIFYFSDKGNLSEPLLFSATDESIDESCISENERAVATWVLKNNKHAGATTDTLSSSRCLYLAIRVNSNVYGVVGIVVGQQPLVSFENSVLLSILESAPLH